MMWATFAMLTDSSSTSRKSGLLQQGFRQNPPHSPHSFRAVLSGIDFRVVVVIERQQQGLDGEA